MHHPRAPHGLRDSPRHVRCRRIARRFSQHISLPARIPFPGVLGCSGLAGHCTVHSGRTFINGILTSDGMRRATFSLLVLAWLVVFVFGWENRHRDPFNLAASGYSGSTNQLGLHIDGNPSSSCWEHSYIDNPIGPFEKSLFEQLYQVQDISIGPTIMLSNGSVSDRPQPASHRYTPWGIIAGTGAARPSPRRSLTPSWSP